MQSFGALALAAALSAAAPSVQQSRPAALSDAGEVYVAELDADWNVSREIRMPCDVDQGCAVDLALSSAGAGRLHVRFDAVHAGKVAIESMIRDDSGRAQQQPALSLSLDHEGFAATHVGADAAQSSAAGPVILMAVKVPGFLAPAAQALPARGQPI